MLMGSLAAAAIVAVLVAGYFTGWFASAKPYSQADLKPQQLTANSSEDPVAVTSISPDGKYLYYSKGRDKSEGLWRRRLDVASGENEEPVLESL